MGTLAFIDLPVLVKPACGPWTGSIQQAVFPRGVRHFSMPKWFRTSAEQLALLKDPPSYIVHTQYSTHVGNMRWFQDQIVPWVPGCDIFCFPVMQDFLKEYCYEDDWAAKRRYSLKAKLGKASASSKVLSLMMIMTMTIIIICYPHLSNFASCEGYSVRWCS